MYPWFFSILGTHLKEFQRVQRNNSPGLHSMYTGVHSDVAQESYLFEDSASTLGVSGISGMEWWNGLLEWNTGMG